MKCIFVIPRMGGGGAERVVSLLANALAEKDNEVTVFTLVGGDSFYELNTKIHFESIGVSVNRKNLLTATWSKIKFFPKSFFAIYKKLRSEDYDVVVSMLTECDLLVGCCKLFGLRFRHVCSERNDPTRRNAVYLKLLKWVYRHASLFVCQGKQVYDFYDTVPQNIKKVIPNPINGSVLPERVDGHKRRIVAVGRLNKQKNFPLLINSFSDLGGELSDYRLDIYGEGPEREFLQSRIDALGLTEKITLCGAKKDVQQLIADADLFVMSSDYEGFPNALLEAMAIGLPVISTDFPTGIARELIGEENGIVVPVNDGAALAAAMDALLKDDEARYQMGINNRQKCQRYYTEHIVSEWEAAINSILGT